LGAVESAVFGLMGLLIAFTFSGAAGRFDDRRHLVRQEANAIGTAWLRIDLVPAEAQPLIDTLRSSLAHILLSRVGPVLRPGTRSYARSWIRDVVAAA